MNDENKKPAVEGGTHVGIKRERLAYLERCAKAVEWVEKHAARICFDSEIGDGQVDSWCCALLRPRLTRNWRGPTWLAAVEAAMKETNP